VYVKKKIANFIPQKEEANTAEAYRETVHSNVENTMRLALYKWKTLVQNPKDPEGLHSTR
jgi:hypothetical protein